MRLLVAYLRVLVYFAFSAVMLTAITVAAMLRPGTLLYWGPSMAWIRGTLKIFGVTLEVTGREHLDPDRTYVVMANHRSQLDPVAMGVAVLPRVTRWVAKQELRSVPFLGKTLEATGQIFVDRGDTSSALSALKGHAGDRDALICFFPEGHRSSTQELLPFKKGGAAFAISSRMWVLPMAVSGSERCLPNHSIVSTPGTIRVAFGNPIDTAGMTDEDRVALTERVRQAIQSMLAELEGSPPARPDAKVSPGARPDGKVLSPARPDAKVLPPTNVDRKAPLPAGPDANGSMPSRPEAAPAGPSR